MSRRWTLIGLVVLLGVVSLAGVVLSSCTCGRTTCHGDIAFCVPQGYGSCEQLYVHGCVNPGGGYGHKCGVYYYEQADCYYHCAWYGYDCEGGYCEVVIGPYDYCIL